MTIDRMRLPSLSDRQWQVLEFMVRGTPRQDIAKVLGTCSKTVDAHRHIVFDKFGVENVPELIHFCYAQGAIKFPENSGG